MRLTGEQNNALRRLVWIGMLTGVLLLLGIPAIAQQAPAGADEEPAKQELLSATAEDVQIAEEDVEEAVRRFTRRVTEFGEDIGDVIESQFERKDKEIDDRYKGRLKQMNDRELKLILDAIETLERFVKLYPNEPKYTPDSMFRLSDLYYEKAEKEFALVQEDLLKEYERQWTMFEEGLRDDEPIPPHPDFSHSIRIYEALAQKFPDYRYIDAVYYMLAYAYQEQRAYADVRRALENLIASRPESEYVAEAYLRIGDAYFNEMNYMPAMEALREASRFTESIFYDQILYKLASTYFILSRFDDSIRTFAKVNDYSEEMLKKDGRHSYFRDEAVKYIAYCYAQGTDYWPNAGEGNAELFFDGLGNRPWEADVFRQLGDYFTQQTKWGEAVAAYKRVLKKDPWNRENPELQNKIIQIYFYGLRDEERQNTEREKLVSDYGEGSQWQIQNADDPEALKIASELALNSLKQWALFQNLQAQKFRSENKVAEATIYYARAAKAYRKFLEKFPHDKQAYELNFNLAEALFYGGSYKEAVVEYLKVRDSKLDDKYFNEAAYSVVICYDNMIGTKGGDIEVTDEEAEKMQRERLKGKIEKREIPELQQKYIAAGEFYVKNAKGKKATDLETIAWNIAGIYFEYDHLEEARNRYIEIVDKFPKSKFAPRAARRIIDTYYLAEDWVKVTEWSEKLASLELGSTEERDKMRAELKVIEGNAIAQYAVELQQRKEYEKAAKQFLKAAEQDTKSENAPKLLYNAAVNYSMANRPATAMKLFQRMVDEFPDAPDAPDALYFVADSAYESFNLDYASKAYERLYTKYPNIDPKRKCAAIINHAQLKEFNREYRQAASIYRKYADQCEAVEKDAPTVLFTAGDLYGKLEDWRNMDRVYNEFIKRYGNQPQNHRYVMQAYFKIGEAEFKRKNRKGGVKYFEKALDFFKTHETIQTDYLSNQMAAAAQFRLIELEREKYLAIRIGGRNQKKMAESFKKKEEGMYELIKKYNTVMDYRSPEYLLATRYRKAETVELFADALFDAPIPREIKKLGEDAVLMYQQALTDQARPFYKQAADQYMEAFEVGKQAKLFTSDWWKRLMDAMNRPNLTTMISGVGKLRKREMTRPRMQVTSPLPMDNGKKHEPVKPKDVEEAPAEQPPTGEKKG